MENIFTLCCTFLQELIGFNIFCISCIFCSFVLTYILMRIKNTKTNTNNNIKKVLASFEGNIAVGKTTFLHKFEQKLKDLNVDFLEEPVKKWSSIKNEKNEGLLEVFYKNMKRWSYTFQNTAYITRMKDIVEKILRSNKKYIFTDRSLQCDKNVFAKMLYDDKKINMLEWNTYNAWNSLFDDIFYGGKYNIIYLRCDPKIAYERMKTRGRDAEKEIPLEYFKSLHEYHDDWLINIKDKDISKYNILILNCDEDFEHNEKKFNDMFDKTMKFIQNIKPYDFNKYIHRSV